MKFSAVFAASRGNAPRVGLAIAMRLMTMGLLVATASAGDDESATAPELTIDALMAHMATPTGVIARFRERKEIALLTHPLESRGVLYFAPPGRLARFTLEPSYSSLVIDGDTIRFREGENGEEFDLSGNPMARVFVDNFIALFAGDIRRIRELYEIEFTTETNSWSLRLIPRSKNLRSAIDSIVLSGTSDGGGGIRTMVMHSSDGDRTTTVLDTREVDRPFTDAELDTLFSERVPLRDTTTAP